MRFLLLILLISYAIMAVSVAVPWVPVTDPLPSLYKEDVFSLLPPAQDSSFFSPYSLQNYPTFLRKLGHFVFYGLLATILFFFTPLKHLWLRGLAAVASSSLIGLLDELHQHLLLHRSGRLLDVYINTAGSVFFITLTIAIYTIAGRARKSLL